MKRYIGRVKKRLIKRSGLNDLHLHDLRHEAISRFIERGLTIPEAASISGHKAQSMLLRYALLTLVILGGEG
jgi:integrase